VELQRALNAGEVEPVIDQRFYDWGLGSGWIPGQVDPATLDKLRYWGVVSAEVSVEGATLSVNGVNYANDLRDSETREAVLRQVAGQPLRNGRYLHGGFFLGPRDFYRKLRELDADGKNSICMTGVRRTNQLLLDYHLYSAQRRDARFINTGMMVSLNGCVASDALEDGTVISGVGGQIARDTQLQALVAIIASFIGIIAYVWIRFQNVAFGLAGVVALVHDVLVVVGAIALSHYVSDFLGFLLIENFRISLPIVAALLTVIGYSLNDTIVVFDRIREVRGKRPEITAEIVNTSICQTLSRTLLTSLTTLIVVVLLYWFGGEGIHAFAFALVIGVIVGTYSSVFIASPILLWLIERGERKAATS